MASAQSWFGGCIPIILGAVGHRELGVSNPVPKGDPRNELPDIFDTLGAEALFEQAEWLWLRHSRPFEPPN
jgi:hypothetical protein